MTLKKLAIALALASAAGCAGRQGIALGQLQPRESVTLDVLNEHWSEVTVFLVRGVVRRRLGAIAGGKEARFLVAAEWLIGNDACLRVEPSDLASAWSSDPLVSESKHTMTFRIAADMSASMRVW